MAEDKAPKAEKKKPAPKEPSKQEKIMHVAMNRGFFYPSAEIYNPISGFWTYGHLGTRLKKAWEKLWRKHIVALSPDYYEIEDCNMMPKKVFESSGHLEHFNDPLTECEKCRMRYRADELVENALKIDAEGLDAEALTKLIADNKLACPKCSGKLGEARMFNMMFDIRVGAMGEETAYLRPETAQSPYLAYKREYESLRKKIPFGLAVIGKAFRNEISPRQGFFRLREFTQAELQIFFNPDKINEAAGWDSVKDYRLRLFTVNEKKLVEVSCKSANDKLPKLYVYHMAKIQQFYLDVLKVPEEKFRFRELSEKERAFYNKIHFDIELDLETLGGFKEVAGLHYRGDHDISGHMKGSKVNLEAMDDSNKKFVPHVLELSFGVDRNVWALMDLFYTEDGERNMFAFPAVVAPYDAAVFPLVNKERLPEISRNVFDDLYNSGFMAFFDTSGSIGRRYRRQDEVGTKFGITVDFRTLEDETVTLRERDSMLQRRIKVSELAAALHLLRTGQKKFGEVGEEIKKD
ncbi:MAG: glycine--tRNA ligase [Candidatus Woesearchaeota archaeon]